MKYRRIAVGVLATVVLSALVLNWGHTVEATERIATLRESPIGGPPGSPPLTGWVIAFQDGRGGQQFFKNPVEVYTVAETDKKVQDGSDAVTTTLRKELAGTKTDILKAIGEVGKKSLEEQQFKALKAALRQELQEEMRKEFKEELRKEIIAELKADKAFLAELRNGEK